MLHRCGEVSFWPPGGDVIGRRRLDGHFYGLKGLGAEIDAEDLPFRMKKKKDFEGRDLFLDEASVTATEHIMTSAVLAKGQTIIRNAAAEPHVQSLAELLNKMGAKISGIGSNTLTIDGVDKLHGTEHTIDGDHIEAGSFLALAAATKGEIKINGTTPRHYWMTRRVFERIGVTFELAQDHIFMPATQEMEIKPDFGNAIPVISDGPWPQFPSDMMSCMIVAATQAKGSALFFEKMFESRIYFVDRLISMGANAIVCDPHRAVITGPSKLRGVEMSSPDIRAGMAMLIAALSAKGESIINNADVISRGYENIVDKILSLNGAISLET
jgi:UDP-N-acetylglucosamine 1-carboxyvinyltransferase